VAIQGRLGRCWLDRLWRGYDPLHHFPGNLFEYDLQGGIANTPISPKRSLSFVLR